MEALFGFLLGCAILWIKIYIGFMVIVAVLGLLAGIFGR